MRRLLVIFLALFLFACSTPEDGLPGEAGADGADGTDGTGPAPNVHIVNTIWETVYETTLSERGIDSVDFLITMRDEYNAAHTDDQWQIIYGDVPPAAAAPAADAYIVAASLDTLAEYHGLARTDLATRREVLRTQAAEDGGTLYIDKAPPEPPPVITDYERYALYLVAADGTILYEEHLTAETFPARLAVYQLQAQQDGHGEYVVYGRLYP